MREPWKDSHQEYDVDERTHRQEISYISELPIESVRDVA